MTDEALEAAARALLARLDACGLRIVTAESCTGGLIAAALTAVPGSSSAVHGGFVTYADAAKVAMLGVDPRLLASHGAVSRHVATAMADGARRRADVGMAIAVTGIAGPGGGSVEKPVGTVWFGVATGHGVTSERFVFNGDRDAVRRKTVLHALALGHRALDDPRTGEA